MASDRIVSILMLRDGLTQSEAESQIEEVRTQMAECNYDPTECEDIFMSELGLEMDYLFDIIL